MDGIATKDNKELKPLYEGLVPYRPGDDPRRNKGLETRRKTAGSRIKYAMDKYVRKGYTRHQFNLALKNPHTPQYKRIAIRRLLNAEPELDEAKFVMDYTDGKPTAIVPTSTANQIVAIQIVLPQGANPSST